MLGSVLKDGQNKNQKRRNSPRISALYANKETQQQKKTTLDSNEEECNGKKTESPSRPRARAKRKFSHLAAKQVSEGRSNAKKREDQSTNTGTPTKLPEKGILELILDILQRRDPEEIFAEPVDPSEVKDYYKFVKEPMDFGTMRAKLHEGMYENLEQFEHDVFLITENAMNFNSSSTIYFKQAKCIFELAKKVFHVLRTDPENFEMEFSGTRRRSIRKIQNESKESKSQRDVKPDNASANTASNSARFFLGVPSTLTRSSKGSPRFSTMLNRTNNKDHVFFPGNADARMSRSAEASRRSTYTTWKSSLENECPKSAILLNERKMSYTESLTRFVEDLGPTAKRIATKKLQVLQANNTTTQAPSFQVPTAYATFRMPAFSNPNAIVGPTTSDQSYATFRMPTFSNPNAITATVSEHKPSDPLTGFGSFTKMTNASKDKPSAEGAEATNEQKNGKKTGGSVLQYKRKDRKVYEAEMRNQSHSKKSEKQWSSFSPIPNSSTDSKSSTFKKISNKSSKRPAGSSVIVDTRKGKDSKIRPVVLALEQSNVPAELRTRNKRGNAPSSSTFLANSQNKTNNGKAEADVVVSKHESKGTGSGEKSKIINRKNNQTSQSPETQQTMGNLPLHLPPKPPLLSSRFAFDMPFLKAQLNQMNNLPAAAQTWDNRFFEATRITPREFGERPSFDQTNNYLRFGSVLSGVSNQDEHQQIPPQIPLIYRNNTNNNNQSSWHSPLDSDLSLQL